MAVRKLSKEGRFEAGVDEIVKGKHWCFIPAINHRRDGPPFVLGVAASNEPGYWPVPQHWAHADSYGEMAEHADELNEAEGISKDEAIRIHCSSMAAGKVNKAEPEDCEHCGGDGLEPAGISHDAGDGEGEDRPCSACSSN